MPLGTIGHLWVLLGSSPPPCCSQDAEGFPIDIKVKDNGDGTFHCVYVPTKAIKHTVIVAWGGVNTPNSPFRVGVTGGSCGAGVALGGSGGVGRGGWSWEGVEVSDVGHGSPVGMEGQGGDGVMWMVMGVPWGAGCGDGGPRPMGCWGRVEGPRKCRGWESMQWLDGGWVPVGGRSQSHGVPGKEGSVPLPHMTLWAHR